MLDPSLDNEEAILPRQPTLDEPVLTTIWRDMKRVLTKLFHVLVPRTFTRASKGVEALRDWDLWGPLIICLLLSVFLYIGSTESKGSTDDQKSTVFAASFFILWVGAGVVTLNALLVGGTLVLTAFSGFFQSVCILGYCVFPIMLAAFVCLIWANVIFRVCIVLVAIAWALTASIGFFAGVVPDGRKALAMYPVFLFYLVLGWMVVLGTNDSSKAPLTPL